MMKYNQKSTQSLHVKIKFFCDFFFGGSSLKKSHNQILNIGHTIEGCGNGYERALPSEPCCSEPCCYACSLDEFAASGCTARC